MRSYGSLRPRLTICPRGKGARSGDTRHMGIFQPKLAALVAGGSGIIQLHSTQRRKSH